jgi:hypothetical protein
MLVTGMIIGTAFTLFVVPSIYVLVAKTHAVDKREVEAEPEGESKGERGGKAGELAEVAG